MRQRPLGRPAAVRCARARTRLGSRVGLALVALTLLPGLAMALKPIVVAPDQERIEITTLGEIYESRGDSLQIETVGGDGLTSRMTVRRRPRPARTRTGWCLRLSNPSDKAIDRWLTAERYTVLGSGAVWPDLDARPHRAITPSLGFMPERMKSDRADMFRFTLEPGQTVTYAAELASDRLAASICGSRSTTSSRPRERQLFNGVMLGTTGLLAIFLTAIFAANHTVIFPATALVAWAVLAYFCVDFGFLHKLFPVEAGATAVYRAAAEAGWPRASCSSSMPSCASGSGTAGA